MGTEVPTAGGSVDAPGGEEVVRSKTQLRLEKRHQLIDLNKEYMNFEIFFECRSADATRDFEMLVINQEQLNTIDLTNLVMKKTRGGYISGNIVADENRYQNYFLVIRAIDDEPLDVDLEIVIKPMVVNTNVDAGANVNTDAEIDKVMPQSNKSAGDRSFWSNPNYVILIALIVILVLIGIYYAYHRYYRIPLDMGGDDDGGSSDSSSSSSSSSHVSKESKGSKKDLSKEIKEEEGLLARLIKKESSSS